MISIGFYKGGVYPYESLTGIILNLAVFHGVPPVTIVKLISTKAGLTKIAEHNHKASVREEFAAQAWLSDAARCFSDAFVQSHLSRGLKFKFCPSCLQIGYHSVFFYFPQVNACTVHREPLIEACARCQNFKTINVAELPCYSCGFRLVRPSDQIHYRKNTQLKMQLHRAFIPLDRWYSSIVEHIKLGDTLFLEIDKMNSYDINPIDATFIKALGWPLPLVLCEDIVAKRKARIIRWATGEKSCTALDWAAACKTLERKHFHAQCPRCEDSIEVFSGYWDGEELSRTLCLKSIVYFLLRIRCSSLSQLSINTGSSKQLGFEYLETLQRIQPTKFGFSAELIRIYFLKLLYNISIYLELGYSVRFRLLPWEGLLYDLSLPGRRENEGMTILGVSSLKKALCCRNIADGDAGVRFCRKDNFGWILALPAKTGEKSIVFNL
ncbi:hypothetical protein [Pseudomonas sp. NPDC096950]|uniref:hypothetical protein n=1 Tax=Pseudomonas sp. NPDC096950 TaxID=3364485 RepID=UPI00383AD9C7